jgi:hypothetical protein
MTAAMPMIGRFTMPLEIGKECECSFGVFQPAEISASTPDCPGMQRIADMVVVAERFVRAAGHYPICTSPLPFPE